MQYPKLLSALLIFAILLAGCMGQDRLKKEFSSIAEAWEEESSSEAEPSRITLSQPSFPEERELSDQPPESSSIVIPEKREPPGPSTSRSPGPQTPTNSRESAPASQAPPTLQDTPPADSRSGGGSGAVIWPSPQAETPKAPETATAAEGIDIQQFETELIRLINAEREEHGRQALSLEDNMRWAARIRAAEVLVNLSHTRPDGTSYYTAFDEAGFVYAGKWHGENISYMEFSGMSYDTASAARYMFDELRSSPGHYTNMLNENFAQIGVGVEMESINGRVRIGSAQMFAGL